MENTLMEIENLSVGYTDNKVAVRVREGINLSLERSQVVCLIGANGAGKSTFLRTIAGFRPPLGGNIRLLGREISGYSQKELSRLLGVVLTEMIGDIHFLSVRDLVSMGRYPYTDCFAGLSREDWSLVDDAMRTVGIGHLSERKVAWVSDGERQKAFIAKALAQGTDIILLDEPLSFLDLPAKLEILSLLKKMAVEQQKSFVLSTHDIELAFAFSDKLWVLDTHNRMEAFRTCACQRREIIEKVFCEGNSLLEKYFGFMER